MLAGSPEPTPSPAGGLLLASAGLVFRAFRPSGNGPPWPGPLARVTLATWAATNNRLTLGPAVMDDTPCRRFFSEPSAPLQRQYEALRAVFLDGLSQKEAAARFGYSYDAFRQLVHQFRHGCAAGTLPPFFSGHAPGGPPPRRPNRRLGRSSPPPPMPGP
jgi:hypothetical protein